MRLVAALMLLLTAPPAAGEERPPSACLALAAAEARIQLAAFGDDVPSGAVLIRYLGHASFAIVSDAGRIAVTDYTGFIGNPDVVPDVVTMNNAHSTHFTEDPDPRIPHVLRGWGAFGAPARHALDLGSLALRNVTTDLRGPFGEGARADGNSVFLFEAAGLCIAHLSHLHQIPDAGQYGAIGRVDVLMVPVDGAFTMDADAMAGVVHRLAPRIVLPMHWFGPEGLAAFLRALGPAYRVEAREGPDLILSRESLPETPVAIVLSPAPIP